MFSSGPNYGKLKTSLRLAQQRLKLMEKKKSELAQKARKEIADYILAGKVERARIRVEQIIREDYLVEAMEIVEMYCDLLLARFGLITQIKELDEGIAEAVASLIWVAPRLQGDIQELKVVSDVLTQKYGKPFSDAVRAGNGAVTASDKLQHKLEIHAPPKLLVEKYLIEIAKVFNVEYEPDPQVMSNKEGTLIDLSQNIPEPPQPGFLGYPSFPILPMPPSNPPYPVNPNDSPGSRPGSGGGSLPSSGVLPGPGSMPGPGPVPAPRSTPATGPGTSSNSSFISKEQEANGGNTTPAQAPSAGPPPPSYDSLEASNSFPTFPILPAVPTDMPALSPEDEQPKNDIDFDDLSKRFEALKKKK